MKGQTKKYQHYVPRKYLEAFGNPQVFCLHESNIVPRNPKGIAGENYFYEFKPLRQQEVFVIQRAIIDSLHVSLKEYAQNWLNHCVQVSKYMQATDLVANMLEEKVRSNRKKAKSFPTKSGKTIWQEIDDAKSFSKAGKANLIEDELAIIEDEAETKVLSELRKKNITVLNDENNRYLLIRYMLAQYLRTKKARAIMSEVAEDVRENTNFNDVDFDLIHLLSIIIYSHNAASINLKDEIILIQNNTAIRFITGDQPIVNLSAEEKNENGEVQSVDMYMPITPKLAILLLKDSSKKFFEDVNNIAESDIKYLNEIIAKNKLSFLFADSEKALMTYKNK